MQDKTFDMHTFLRSILKHDADIPDNLGTGQAVGGSRHAVETLQTSCVELFAVTFVLL